MPTICKPFQTKAYHGDPSEKLLRLAIIKIRLSVCANAQGLVLSVSLHILGYGICYVKLPSLSY